MKLTGWMGLVLVLALMSLVALPAAAQQKAMPGKEWTCPMGMMGHQQSGEMMGMMSDVSMKMAERLNAGAMSAEESKRMGKCLGEMSMMMKDMSQPMPAEKMGPMRERMQEMTREKWGM
jgi:hypothetical protein